MRNDLTSQLDAVTPSAAWRRVGITDRLDVDLMPYMEFTARVLREGIAHVLARRWATTSESIDAVLPYAEVTSRWDQYETAVLDLAPLFGSDCLAYVWRGDGGVSVRIAARDLPAVADAEAWFRSEFPERVPTEEQSVPVTFWSVGDLGGFGSSRSIDVPTWSEIEQNYPQSVRTLLTELFHPGFRPAGEGRLLLWHGEPGTGKTYALRALAWEWREWCECFTT